MQQTFRRTRYPCRPLADGPNRSAAMTTSDFESARSVFAAAAANIETVMRGQSQTIRKLLAASLIFRPPVTASPFPAAVGHRR